MDSEHIISMIEDIPPGKIAELNLARVTAHVEVCESCKQAWQAAQISEFLVRERAAETFSPTPFFETRVLAAWREQQSNQWSWAKMWRAAGALASSMVATVAAIAVLTFAIPGAAGDAIQPDQTVAGNAYSAEEVILNQPELVNTEQVSDAQVLATLYGADEER